MEPESRKKNCELLGELFLEICIDLRKDGEEEISFQELGFSSRFSAEQTGMVQKGLETVFVETALVDTVFKPLIQLNQLFPAKRPTNQLTAGQNQLFHSSDESYVQLVAIFNQQGKLHT